MLYFHHSLFHAAFYHYIGRVFYALKFAERPTCDADHASNWRFAPNIYTPYRGWLEHSDTALRSLVSEFGTASAAQHARGCALKAPWGRADAEFFAEDSEHYEVRDLEPSSKL